MAYPGNFHRGVIYGTLYQDIFNITFSVIPTVATPVDEPTDALVTAVADAIAGWWSDGTGTGIQMNVAAKMLGLKLNRITASGHYQDATTHFHEYPGGIAGVSGPLLPAQLACVLSLRTGIERGPAAKGRMFFPAPNGFGAVNVTAGTVTDATVDRIVTAGAKLIHDINAAYASIPLFSNGKVGVASKSGLAGGFQTVTHVSVGHVPDTIRSRRSALVEAPHSAPIV